jgi:hypothetical protein
MRMRGQPPSRGENSVTRGSSRALERIWWATLTRRSRSWRTVYRSEIGWPIIDPGRHRPSQNYQVSFRPCSNSAPTPGLFTPRTCSLETRRTWRGKAHHTRRNRPARDSLRYQIPSSRSGAGIKRSNFITGDRRRCRLVDEPCCLPT